MNKNANKKPFIKIYTDGACSGNPGPGAWAFILIYEGIEKEMSGYEANTTNNRMEQTAAIKALEALNKPCRVELYSDSSYLLSAFNEGWLDNWQNNGWKNSAGQMVSNPDLWKRLLALNKKHQIKWIKVKGHADDIFNNRCDKMAVQAVKIGNKNER